MTTQHLVRKVAEVLEDLKIPYMLVGSFSSNAYGVPRNTHDADFVVQLGDVSISDVAGKLGPTFQLDPQLSFETITSTTRFVFNVPGEQFKIEMFLLSDDAHDQSRFQRRQVRAIVGRRTFLPTAEDVVVTKLRWSRHGKRRKDIDDVRDVIAISGSQLDWTYIHHWCDQHGTRQLLDDIRQSLPPL